MELDIKKLIANGLDEAIKNNTNKVLWTGAWWMNASQTVTLTENVLDQPHGIVLVWSGYVNGEVQNYDFNYIFIPKWHVSVHGGTGVAMILTNSTLSAVGSKYIYVHNDRLVGNAQNDQTGTGSGITKTNNRFVLRAVIGV